MYQQNTTATQTEETRKQKIREPTDATLHTKKYQFVSKDTRQHLCLERQRYEVQQFVGSRLMTLPVPVLKFTQPTQIA